MRSKWELKIRKLQFPIFPYHTNGRALLLNGLVGKSILSLSPYLVKYEYFKYALCNLLSPSNLRLYVSHGGVHLDVAQSVKCLTGGISSGHNLRSASVLSRESV